MSAPATDFDPGGTGLLGRVQATPEMPCAQVQHADSLIGVTILLPDDHFRRTLELFKLALQLNDRHALIIISGVAFMSESLVLPGPSSIHEFLEGTPLYSNEVSFSLLSPSDDRNDV